MLGDAPGTPKKYSMRLKRLSLGMPLCIPFFINNYQYVLPSSIFLLPHMLCALLGAYHFSFKFCFVLFCFLVITSWILACLIWERNTLHFFLECSQFSLLSFFECSIFISSLLPCLALVLHLYLVQRVGLLHQVCILL